MAKKRGRKGSVNFVASLRQAVGQDHRGQQVRPHGFPYSPFCETEAQVVGRRGARWAVRPIGTCANKNVADVAELVYAAALEAAGP